MIVHSTSFTLPDGNVDSRTRYINGADSDKNPIMITPFAGQRIGEFKVGDYMFVGLKNTFIILDWDYLKQSWQVMYGKPGAIKPMLQDETKRNVLKQLLVKIDEKNSWGKNELKLAILEILAG